MAKTASHEKDADTPSGIITDELLVKRVIAGDVDAYGQIMERYEPKLMRYAVTLTGNYDIAPDIVQETFIKVYQNLQSYNPKYKFSSWIYRIAHNQAINSIKREKHFDRHVDIDQMAELTEDFLAADYIDASFMRSDVLACLSVLQTKQREILLLFFFEQMKYSEIADVLRIPTSTVGVRLSRAKSALRKICEQKGVQYE